MVQSWQNFMSPTGGQMESAIETGWTGLIGSFGADLSIPLFINPSEKDAVKRYKKGYFNKARSIKNQLPSVKYEYDYAVSTNDLKFPYLNKGALVGRARAGVANIRSKYSGMRTTANAIGWGFLALGAAQIMEAITTPGISMAAQENNASSMGFTPPLDSSQAYTQRQRALMAIHDSQLGIRNVIGSEAGYLHR